MGSNASIMLQQEDLQNICQQTGGRCVVHGARLENSYPYAVNHLRSDNCITKIRNDCRQTKHVNTAWTRWKRISRYADRLLV